MKYNNLHEYLDDALSGIADPTHLQIKEAKRDYWRLYFRHYRRERRKKYHEFTLGFDAETVKQLHKQKGKVTSVSKYLYTIVQQALYKNVVPTDTQISITAIGHDLRKLLDVLEAEIDNNALISEELLDRIEAIEYQFDEFFNTPDSYAD